MSDHWEASTLEDAKALMWNPDDWEAGTTHCLAMIEPHLIYGGLVLDIGSGIGRLTKPLAQRHRDTLFIGYEPSDSLRAFAVKDAEPNETHMESLATPFFELADSAFSVVTFQHMSDDEVYELIERMAPVPLRAQFALGTISEPLNYQRSVDQISELLDPYDEATIEHDPVYPTWLWVTTR